MKKQNKIIRNIKFFVPLLLKLSPITLVSIILLALINSVSTFLNIFIPAMIIGELMGGKEVTKLIILIALLVGNNFFINILRTFFNSIMQHNSMKAQQEIESMLNNKVMTVDYFNIEDPEFLDLMNRAKKGMNDYTNGIYSFTYTLQTVFSNVINILGIIGIIISSGNYLLVVVALLGVLVNSIIYQKVQNNNQKFRNDMSRTWRRCNYYNRNIANFRMQKDLRLYAGKEMIQDITNEENKILNDKCMKQSRKQGFLFLIDNFTMYYGIRFLTIFLLGLAAFSVENAITIAMFSLLFNAIMNLDYSSANLIYSLQEYFKACEYQNDYIDLMEKETIFKDGKEEIFKIEEIEFKNVSFKYPRTDKYILKNVSFVITNKEKISLVGLNGAGKTTIIKLLCRFFDVNEGAILINGINIRDIDYESYMKKLAIVFQDFRLISLALKSNVAILDNNQEKLYDCLKRAQVLERVLSLPNKEDTYINKWFDKTGIEFSGGEMQKLAIARALYKDGDFVVLDEPTSALDPMAEAEIYYHFNDVVGKKLTLFISHRLSSCIFSDRILVLDGADIVEEGTHKELINKKDGLYAKMFNAQAEYYK